jgi:kanamycin kinase
VLADLRRRYAGHDWTPVTLGMSGARVWSAGPFYIKADNNELCAEADRLRWLESAGIPAPRLVESGADGEIQWLVMTAIPGCTAADPWPAEQRDRVVDAVADFTAWMHGIPIGGCPFDRTLAVTAPHAQSRLYAGQVDLADLDPERAGWTRAELAQALAAQLPADEDLAICHGDASLPNFLLDPETLSVTGIVDVGRVGVADRHSDLGLTTRSLGIGLNDQYPPGSGRRFLRRYAAATGAVIDDGRLAFYRLLDEFF